MEIRIARSEAGEEVHPAAVGASPSDYIVGQYSDGGAKIRRGATVGGSRTEAHVRNKLIEFMERKGERMQVATPKATQPAIKPGKQVKSSKRKPKAAAQEELPAPFYAEEAVEDPIELRQEVKAPALPIPKPIVVVFNTELGKIKVIVDAVLEADQGLALVFKHEDEVRYVPERGHELELVVSGNPVKVMYLGHLYNWYVGTQQVMTFIKLEEK